MRYAPREKESGFFMGVSTVLTSFCSVRDQPVSLRQFEGYRRDRTSAANTLGRQTVTSFQVAKQLPWRISPP